MGSTLTENETWSAYDKDGKYINSYVAVDVTTEYLNPDEVKEAIENLESVCNEQFGIVSDKLNTIAPDVGSAINVGDTNMQKTIEEVATQINTDFTPAIMDGGITGLYDEAVRVHNTTQEQCNSDAKSSAQKLAGSEGTVRLD